MENDTIAVKDGLQESVNAGITENSVIKDAGYRDETYVQTDIFLWANNLVQYVDDIKIELYFFNKNFTVYRTKLVGQVSKQFRPLFIDDILEYILGGIEQGLIVRDFEEAEKEENVLQRTKIQNVDKLMEVFGWLWTQKTAIEEFSEEEHDLRRMKGVVAVCSHKELDKPFYVIKNLPTTQIMKGPTAWILKDDTFKPFDKMSAMKIPAENQLLVVGHDMFIFNQSKLKQLFGYDAKAASIAKHKVAEIETNFKLSFAEGVSMQSLVKGKPGLIKKLQNIQPSLVKQRELLDHAEEIGVELMEDDGGAIIILDDKDLTKFINLLNDDYIESPLTGQRYEIVRKRPLKPSDDSLENPAT